MSSTEPEVKRLNRAELAGLLAADRAIAEAQEAKNEVYASVGLLPNVSYAVDFATGIVTLAIPMPPPGTVLSPVEDVTELREEV